MAADLTGAALDEQGAQEPTNKYDDLFRQQEQAGQQRLRTSLTQADDTTPDRAAEVQKLATRVGVPPEIVERNFDQIAKRAKFTDTPYAQMQRETPSLAAWAAEPANAAVAADDMEQLGALEWLVKAPSRAFLQGLNQVKFGRLRTQSLFRPLSQTEQDQLALYRIGMEEGGQLGAGNSWFRTAVTGGAQQLPNLFGAGLYAAKYGAYGAAETAVLGAGVGAIAGLPEGGVGAIPGAAAGAIAGAGYGARAGAFYGAAKFGFEIEAGNAYDEYLGFKDEHGNALDPTVAKAAALATGMINAGLEGLGFEAIIKSIPGVGKLTQVGTRSAVKAALRSPTVRAALFEAVKSYAGTLTAETMTEVAQRAVTILSGELAKYEAQTNPQVAPGQIQPGNLDLFKQPRVQNADGTISTVDSVGVNVDGKELLLSKVTPDGRHLETPEQAIAEYQKTGKHLGVFETPEASTAFASQLHEDYAAGKYDQDSKYRSGGSIARDLIDEGVGALSAFAFTVGAGPAMQLAHGERQARQATQATQFFKALGAQTAGSKTIQRMPEAAQKFLAHATKDGPIETVYAPADTWVQYWQSKHVDPAQMAAEITGKADALEQAQNSGTDLAIPTARYAVTLAPTEHNGFFASELRLGPDQMNGREAKAFEQQQKQTPTTQQEAEQDTALAGIRGQVIDQLVGAGVPAETASSYAELYESAFGTMAERAGVEPAALFEQYGLKVERPALGANQSQIAPNATKQTAVEQSGAQGPVQGPITAADRIAQLETELRGAQRAAETDPLTGLANRAALDRALPAAEADPHTAVVAFDANNFGQVNKQIGHEAGDAMLKDIAAAITQAATESGVGGRVFRRGGDEFVALAPTSVADTIRARAEEIFGAKQAGTVEVSISGTHGGTFAEADATLQAAKATRKNTALLKAEAARAPRETANVSATPEAGQGRENDPREQPGADGEGVPEGAGDGHRAERSGLQAAGHVDYGDTYERRPKAETEERLSPEVTRELDRMREEMETFPFEERHWHWLGQFEKKTGNAAGGEAIVTAGHAGAPVYDDVLYLAPLNMVTSGRRKGKLAQRAHGTRAAVLASIRKLLGARDVLNNLAEGALRVAERRAAGDWKDLSPAMLAPSWGQIAPREFTDELSSAIDRELQPVDLLDSHESEIIEPEGDVDTSFDIKEFSQSLFDDLEPPDPKVDKLTSGEEQPRLPGDVGDVRETETATPEMDAPFSLTSEIAKPKAKQTTLFQREKSRVLELEQLATDEAMGVVFPNDGPSHFPDGSDAVVCTNCAEQIIAKVGGEVFGWEEGTNPTSIVAGPAHGAQLDQGQGHDFAIVEGRYLVDAWAKNVEGSSQRAVFDLTDPSDRLEVRRLYGDPLTWKRRTAAGWVAEMPAALSQGPATLTAESVQAWAAELQRRVGPALKAFDVRLLPSGNLQLETIALDRGANRAGLGSKVMQELTRFADLNGRKIELSLAEKGYAPVEGSATTTSKDRLRKFYKRFGFVDNRGRHKDYRLSIYTSMYREPTAPGPITEFSQSPPVFYSRLVLAVEQSKQPKAPGAQWKAAIRNAKSGINKEEFLLAHVDDLEDGTSYTKQEVLDYLKANEIQVEDVTLEGDKEPDANELERRTEAAYREQLQEAEDRELDRFEPVLGAVEARYNEDEDKWEAFYQGEDVGGYYDTEAEAEARAEEARDDHQSQQEREALGYVEIDRDAIENNIHNTMLSEMADHPRTQYGEYSEPGAKEDSYREVFLTAPGVGGGRQFDVVDHPSGEGFALLDRSLNIYDLTPNGVARRWDTRELANYGIRQKRTDTWEDGHDAYSWIVNPIVRLRLDERESGGKRVLFLEEVQPPAEHQQEKMPPLLIKNWRELAFKWALRYAAANGFESLAWTTGEMQARRYSLEKQVDAIRYRKRADGTFTFSVWKDGRSIDRAERHAASAKEIEELVGGEILARMQAGEGDVDVSKVQGELEARGAAVEVLPIEYDGIKRAYVEVPPEARSAIGDSWAKWGIRYADGSIMGLWGYQNSAEEEAKRQNDDLQGEKTRKLTGDNLKIGGAGLKRLYDVDFRNVVNSLPAVKKNGGKVGTIGLHITDRVGMQSAAAIEKRRGSGIEKDEHGRFFFRLRDGGTVSGTSFGGGTPWTTFAAAEKELIAWNEHIDNQIEDLKPKAVPALAITPELREAVMQSQPLFQGERKTGERRGAIRFGADRQMNIELLERADLSTFLHESGHFFLEVFGDLADRFTAVADPTTLTDPQKRMIADYGKLLTWLGVDSRQALAEDAHEQFARAFEAYLMEGKAPSLELQGAFSRFRAWLVGVYRSLVNLNVRLTPEVRGIFDRLLASDAAIADAEARRGIPQMFTTATDAGMSATEFDLYTRAIAAASRTAREELDNKLLADVRREQTAAYKAQRKEIEQQVAAGVHERREYRALAAMQRGTQPNGQPIVEGLTTPPLRLSRAILVDRYGADRLARLPKFVYSREGGLDPDLVAQMFGFSSGDELLDQVEHVPAMGATIQAETDRRMLAEHGSLLLDGGLQDAARTAISNEDRDRIIRAELRALAQLRRTVAPFVKAARGEAQRERAYERRWFEAEAKLNAAIAKKAAQEEIDALRAELQGVRAQSRGGAARINAALPSAALVRDTAKARLAGLRVREIKPELFWSASRRAAQQAIDRAARQDFDGAIAAKQQELLNLAMYRQSERLLEDVAARVKFAKGLAKPAQRAQLGLAGDNYLDQVDGILDRYEFAKASAKVLERRASLRKFVEGLEAAGLPVDMPEELLDEARRTNYQQLTVDELVGVTDGLKAIVHLAHLKNRLLKNAERRELDATAGALADSIREHAGGKRAPALERDRRVAGERSRLMQDFFASHRKLASLARELDGFIDGGPAWEAIIRPLNEAGAEEAEQNAKATRAFGELVERAYPGAQKRALYTKSYIAPVGQSLSKMARLMVALNWGNEGNRDRVRRAEGWSDEQVTAIIATLDKRDLDFVQGVFDLVNGYWPEIAAKQERVYGIAPDKVEATPIRTPFGDYAGGYFPLKYDDRLAAGAAGHLDLENANLARAAAYAQSTTKRGHTKARVQSVKLPVRLDFGVMFEHVRQVIHDLTHHEALIDVGRVLAHPAVQKAIYETYGDIVYKQFKNGVRDVAFGDLPAVNAFERAINHLRVGSTIAGLGWNLSTALLQPLGLTQSIVRIGPRWVAQGAWRWLRDAASMENTNAWVNEKSAVMRVRALTQQREINEIRNKVGVSTGKFSGWVDSAISATTFDVVTRQGIADSYFYLIQQMQRVADLPTWLGQYEKSLAAGEPEDRAIALADQAVLDAQGGGQVKDLAAIQRGGPLMRLWTNFYSFFNTTYNLTVESSKRARFNKPGSIGRLAVDYLMLYTVPVIVGYGIRQAFKPDDDDRGWVEVLTREQLAYMMGTVLGLRELSATVQGYYGYEGPAGARAFAQAARLMQQAQQGEADAAFWHALNDTGGTLFHYPSSQTRRTIDGIAALAEGRTKNPGALIQGPAKESRAAR